MSVSNIKNLEALITQFVDGNKKIVNTKISRLTTPGENFGSEILKLDLVLKSEGNGKDEELHAVVKLLPELDFFRIIFNVQVTFNSEIGFYEKVVPTLREFQRNQGIQESFDFFPEFYGARRNLKHSNEDPIDDDAIIILENLKVQEFVNVDRQVGFDLATTKLILKYLARFHAVPLALKRKDPRTFETNIKPYLACFNAPGPIPPYEKGLEKILQVLDDSDKCKHLIPKLVKSFEHFCTPRKDFKEPFATVAHKDFWVNNVMVRFENNVLADCKFVDFQMYSYDSPAADLFFFLFTSVETDALQNNLDDLLKFYHQQFVENLKSLKCDLSLSYEGLLEEIRYCVEWELSHAIFMYFFVVKGEKEAHKFKNDGEKLALPDFSHVKFAEPTIKKLTWMMEELEKRGWLNFKTKC